MKRTYKITVAIIGSVVLALGCTIWTIGPAIGPMLGLQRTTDEEIEFIKHHNTIILVDPVPVIKNGTGSYSDWALAEFEMRRRIAIVLWIAGSVPLGFWAARKT
jgi:hypothetical protein